MQKLTGKKAIGKMTFLFMMLYMISYITRINYGAIVSEMVEATGMTKAMLSMALTGSFITYGAGQIISGICGDKLPPKKLIMYGLFVTATMNILIPFCNNGYQMLAVWCVNGFAQAFMWPPLVKIMVMLFDTEDYNAASVKVSWGSSFGTISVYFLGPILILISGWKSVFFVCASMAVIMALIWNKACVDTPVEPVQKTKEEKVKYKLFTPTLIMIMITIILQGMLRDGVTTWMPSYISETYNLSRVVSILTGVIMPIFSIVSFSITSKLYKKYFSNPVLCAGVIFGFGAVSALALYLLSSTSAAISVLLSALLTGSMHGVNLVLICYIPSFFRKYGNISTVSGVLNSCTYVGSAISTYGIALISEARGWTFTIFIWFIIALLGTVISFVAARPWKKQYM